MRRKINETRLPLTEAGLFLLHLLLVTKLQHIIQFGKAPFFQPGKNLCVIDQYGELAFLLTGDDFHHNISQFFFEFRSETRCAGLMPSGCAIDNLDVHLFLPFRG